MHTTSTRLVLGFTAGFLSYLIFQGALGTALYAAHLMPALPWSLEPVPPLGVPKVLSLGFWDGLWGVVYALLEPRLTARFGRWRGGILFGFAPLAVYWFVVLPLKGFGVGGGFPLAEVPIQVTFDAVFGVGTAFLFWSGLLLARRRSGIAPEAQHG